MTIQSFPIENLKRALINMKAYCCRQKLLETKLFFETCEADKSLWWDSDKLPFSPMLFDQLLDVALRALEGNITQTYSDAIWDPLALEWRDLMDEFGWSTGGILPQAIQNKFNEYWKPQPEYELIRYDWQSSAAYLSQINQMEHDKKILSNFDDRSLYTKYMNICPIVTYLTFKIDGGNIQARDMLSMFNSCYEKVIPNILKQESDYVESTIITKSNTLLNDGMSNHIEHYFFKTRGESMLAKMQNTSSYLQQIVRLVSKLIHKTS